MDIYLKIIKVIVEYSHMNCYLLSLCKLNIIKWCVIPVSTISEISSIDSSLLSSKLLIPSSPKKASNEAVESKFLNKTKNNDKKIKLNSHKSQKMRSMSNSYFKNLCLEDAPSPRTAESCFCNWPDCLSPVSGLGDGEATGVVGGVAGDPLSTSLPILILGLLGESLSII